MSKSKIATNFLLFKHAFIQAGVFQGQRKLLGACGQQHFFGRRVMRAGSTRAKEQKSDHVVLRLQRRREPQANRLQQLQFRPSEPRSDQSSAILCPA